MFPDRRPTWQTFSEGLPTSWSVLALAIDPGGTAILVGTSNGGVFRRPLNELPPEPIDRMDPVAPSQRIT